MPILHRPFEASGSAGKVMLIAVRLDTFPKTERTSPYQPYFLAATIVFLGTGYWLIHRASKATCVEGEACARPLPNRLVKIVLVVAKR
jgi:hypothetical protein